ncbi:RadC family protein [Sandaracinobacter sp.]|uniref:JAB domain-containing protein n=1 Tax=Sandaracinobacter sp. TaxID=2487581 RepID=UPI0035B02892
MGAGLRAASQHEPRDRWLLMRLLAAGQSMPKLADRLIEEQGSLGSVLTTSEERLRQLGADTNGIAILKLIRETISVVLERGAQDRLPVDGGAALAEAMFSEMAHLAVEQVRVAFLDAGRRLIRIEVMGSGTVHFAHVYPREIARRCLELSASSVVLVHNHPSGDPTPSPEDIQMTKRIRKALEAIDAALFDHLVIGRKGYISFQECGLI